MEAGSFDGRRALVTGGLGFIGSNLVLRLVREGARVTVVDCLLPGHGGCDQNIASARDNVAVHHVDIRDSAAVRELLPDQEFVFNLAAQTSHQGSIADPQLDFEINTLAQLSLLEACRDCKNPPKVVFTSTRQVYGRPLQDPVDETHRVAPLDLNGVHKLTAEGYHQVFSAVYGLPTCVLRLTNTYGPRMRIKDSHQSFLGGWIGLALKQQPATVFGDGAQFRDFTYVDDCIDALLAAAVSPAAIGSIYNLGGECRSLFEVAHLLSRIAGSPPPGFVPFPADLQRIDIGSYRADFARASRDLDWQPRTSFAEGLARTVAFFAGHT
jgi:UDP-glucose 4-epimerase